MSLFIQICYLLSKFCVFGLRCQNHNDGPISYCFKLMVLCRNTYERA